MNVFAAAFTAARVIVPSPQSTSTVCVSSVPTSVMVPVTVTVPCSSITSGVTVNPLIVGVKLLTVTLVWAWLVPPSSSLTTAVIV